MLTFNQDWYNGKTRKMKNPFSLQITLDGYKKLEEEFKRLTEKRPGVLTRMVAAREQGDLSENAGYHAAKDELGQIDRRVRELKLLLKHAQIANSQGSGTISLGNRVLLKNEGAQTEFHIVSALEADPTKGKISDASPIGKELLGKKTGDHVEIVIPDGKIVYEVVEIKD